MGDGIRLDIEKAGRKYERLKAEITSLREERDRLRQQLIAVKNSLSYRLGSLLIHAVARPGLNTVSLPYRLTYLCVEGLRRRRTMAWKPAPPMRLAMQTPEAVDWCDEFPCRIVATWFRSADYAGIMTVVGPGADRDLFYADQALSNTLHVHARLEPYRYDDEVDWNVGGKSNTWCLWFQSLRIVGYLANAAEATGDARYLEKAAEIIESWFDFHHDNEKPPSYAWGDHAVADRVRNVMHFLRAYSAVEDVHLPDSFLEKVHTLLHEHGNWLLEEKNYHPYNHGMMASMALTQIALTFPELDRYGSRKQTGISRVRARIRADLSAENVHREHSAFYHVFFLDLVLRMEDYLDCKGVTLFEAGDETVEEMKQYVAYMAKPDGRLPMIGDTSDDRVARHYGHPWVMYSLSEGKEGVRPPNNSMVYPDAGVAILRDEWRTGREFPNTYLFFQAAFHSTVHKHADDLGFVFYSHGEDILVGPGVYAYDSSKYRQYVRSAQAHNNLAVDGKSYTVSRENIGKADITAYSLEDAFDFVQGSHTMYDGVALKRGIVFIRPSTVLVVDEAVSDDQYPIQQIWTLAPAARDLEFDRDGVSFVVGENGVSVNIRQLRPTEGVNHYYGQDEPVRGFMSPQQGELVPIHQVEFENKGSGVVFVTQISVTGPGEEAPDIGVDLHNPYERVEVRNPDGSRVTIDLGSRHRSGTPLNGDNMRRSRVSCTGAGTCTESEPSCVSHRRHEDRDLWRGVAKANQQSSGYRDALADPAKVIYVDPAAIIYSCRFHMETKTKRGHKLYDLGRIQAGDWDLEDPRVNMPFQRLGIEGAVKERYWDGRPWEETGMIETKLKQIERSPFGVVDGCRKRAELLERYRRLDAVFEDVKQRGIVLAEVRGGRFGDDLFVSIGRHGQLLFAQGGNHRLAMCRLLQLPKIPVRVVMRHAAWQEKRIAAAKGILPAVSGGGIHPDLQEFYSGPPALSFEFNNNMYTLKVYPIYISGKKARFLDHRVGKRNVLLALSNGCLYWSGDMAESWSVIPNTHARDYRQGFVTEAGNVLVWDRKRKQLDLIDLDGRVLAEHRAPHPWHGSWGIGQNGGTILYAEYDSGNEEESYSVYRSADAGRTWTAVLSKSTIHEIRHFHTVQADRYHPGHWYLSSGDMPLCSKVWLSKDDGHNWTEVTDPNPEGVSHQSVHRFTSLAFTKDYIYWGTDDLMGGDRALAVRARRGEPLQVEALGHLGCEKSRVIVSVDCGLLIISQAKTSLETSIHLLARDDIVFVGNIRSKTDKPSSVTWSCCSRRAVGGRFFSLALGSVFGHNTELYLWEMEPAHSTEDGQAAGKSLELRQRDPDWSEINAKCNLCDDHIHNLIIEDRANEILSNYARAEWDANRRSRWESPCPHCGSRIRTRTLRIVFDKYIKDEGLGPDAFGVSVTEEEYRIISKRFRCITNVSLHAAEHYVDCQGGIDIRDMPSIPSRRFCLALACDVLDYIPEVTMVFDEMRRILVDGGILLFFIMPYRLRDDDAPCAVKHRNALSSKPGKYPRINDGTTGIPDCSFGIKWIVNELRARCFEIEIVYEKDIFSDTEYPWFICRKRVDVRHDAYSQSCQMELDSQTAAKEMPGFGAQLHVADEKLTEDRIAQEEAGQDSPETYVYKLHKERDKLDKQLSEVRNSLSYRLGNMLVEAVCRPGRNTVLVPYRLVRLGVEGLREFKPE